MKLTASNVDGLPLPAMGKNQAIYFDDEVKGLGVRVTAAGSRSWVFDTRANGKSRRITIGPVNAVSIVIAKRKAKELAGKIAAGVDPVVETKTDRLKAKTLGEVVEDYIAARKLKPGTVKDLRTAMRQMSAWQDRPITEITEDMVSAHHRTRGKLSPARANLEVRYLKAVINFATAAYRVNNRPTITTNPAGIVGANKQTFRVERRSGHLAPHELRTWLAAVQGLDSEWADFFLTLIATGLRRQEALDLRWEDIDLLGGTLTVQDPKNHQRHTLPLPTRTWEMLVARKSRYDARPKAKQIGFVFSDEYGDRMTNPRYAVANMKKLTSGLDVNPHDLRRTFATIASELDFGAYTIKRLMNHSDGGDVTAGYIRTSMTKLRQSIQQIEDVIYGVAA